MKCCLNPSFFITFMLILVCSCTLSVAESSGGDKMPSENSGKMNIESDCENSEIKLNIFAAVSENLVSLAHDVSETLYAEEDLVTFPRQGYQLHCTLFMTQYPASARYELLDLLVKTASQTRVFDIVASKLEVTSSNWFFINLECTKELQNLADIVAKHAAVFRCNSDYVPEWAKEFPRKVEYIKKFGSPNVFEEFNPHLTLLPPSDKEKLDRFTAVSLAAKRFSLPMKGKVVALGIGLADKNGQMINPWAVIPLQSEESDH